MNLLSQIKKDLGYLFSFCKNNQIFTSGILQIIKDLQDKYENINSCCLNFNYNSNSNSNSNSNLKWRDL